MSLAPGTRLGPFEVLAKLGVQRTCLAEADLRGRG